MKFQKISKNISLGSMLKIFLYLSYLQCVLTSTITDGITQAVNGHLKDLSPSEISEKIQLHYQLLGLLDTNGDWVHYYFKIFPNGISLFPRYEYKYIVWTKKNIKLFTLRIYMIIYIFF